MGVMELLMPTVKMAVVIAMFRRLAPIVRTHQNIALFVIGTEEKSKLQKRKLIMINMLHPDRPNETENNNLKGMQKKKNLMTFFTLRLLSKNLTTGGTGTQIPQ